MNKTKRLSYPTMKKRIKEISSFYFLCKDKRNKQNRLCSNIVNETNDIYDRFVARVNNAFSLLSAKEKELINNDFFFNDYPLWWQSSYSKTSYYHLAYLAMKKFLYYYDENK